MDTCVKEMMKDNILTVQPEDTLATAAKKMRDSQCGCLLVGTEDNPIGVITDRDIVIRAMAEGRDPNDEKVRDFMSESVKGCHPDDTLPAAAEKMRQYGVSRLLVVDDENVTCGIITLGRILRNSDKDEEITEVIACATGRKSTLPNGQKSGDSSTQARH